jgi:hypothetical protein
LYEYSTKLDAEKHGCSGLARIIPAAEGAQFIRSNLLHPPNSRSIFSLQKNGTDAERYAEHRAESRAVLRADDDAEPRADIFICRSEIKFHREGMRRSGFALIRRWLTAFMATDDDTK